MSFNNTVHTLLLGSKIFDLSKVQVMGILNVTKDSFYDGGQYTGMDAAKSRLDQMVEDGASMIDLGAYSSRPGALDVPVQVEVERLLPVIRWMNQNHPDIGLSVDTFRSSVAQVAIEHGAHIINDISGGSLDPAMFETVANLQVPYILMHMRGTPQDMQLQTDYEDLLTDMSRYFAERIARLRQLGVKDILLDPGFGFAKTTAQNFELLARLDHFDFFDLPLLGGVSRKSMIYKTLEITPQEALNGTTVIHTMLLQKGVKILRVHDVKEAVQVVRLVEALNEKRENESSL
jgi:dihydropteroate synthase